MNVYVKLGLVLGIVLALAASVRWVVGEVEEGKRAAYDAGRKEALLEVAQRDNKNLAEARAEIDRLRNQAQEQEAHHAEAMVALDEEATRRVADAEARKEQFVSDVVSGRLRLFDRAARRADAGCPGSGGSSPRTAVAAGSVGDAAGGAELSPALAGFLVSEAGRANKVVAKVTYLQGVVREYLATCNGTPAAAGVSSH